MMTLEELAYRYRPRLWHAALPVSILMLAWGVIHTSGALENWFCIQVAECPNYERITYGLAGDWFIAAALVIVALLFTVWMILAGILAAGLDYYYEETGQRLEPKDFHASLNRIQFDKRWKKWAEQVLEGRSLAINAWCGEGKLFRRPEYEKRMNNLWRRNVLEYTNGKTADNGYIINGEGGRKYIEAMARGDIHLPNPLPRPTVDTLPNNPVFPAYDTAYDEKEEART